MIQQKMLMMQVNVLTYYIKRIGSLTKNPRSRFFKDFVFHFYPFLDDFLKKEHNTDLKQT